MKFGKLDLNKQSVAKLTQDEVVQVIGGAARGSQSLQVCQSNRRLSCGRAACRISGNKLDCVVKL